MQQPKPAIRFITVLFIIALALFLRLHNLGAESLFMDEARQVSYYKADLGGIIKLAAAQQQPPLDNWLGHFIVKVSNSDFAVRLPAAIFGTGSIVFLYLLAVRFCSWPFAAVISLVAALLPFNLYFSQEARPYAMAIFFLLAMLWALDSLLKTKRHLLLFEGLFLLATLGFFYSRALSPLVTVGVLFTIICGDLLFMLWRRRLVDKDKLWKLVIAVGMQLIAFGLYIPVLIKILAFGKRYLNASMTFPDLIGALAQNFNIMPLWKAFVAQTEPLTMPFLFLLFCAPVLTLWCSSKRFQTLWVYILVLLPSTALLNLLVFQARANYPFRPPYAIYILPLVLLISAGTLQALWALENLSRPLRQLLRIVVVSGCVFLIAGAAYGAMSYKMLQRKTDWRGLGEYLSVYNTQQILLFHNTSLYGTAPLLRYNKSRSLLTDVQGMLGPLTQKISTAVEPVFIFFQAGPYYLTDRSRYPIMPATRQIISGEGISKIIQKEDLLVTQFKNLLVIKLRTPSRNLARDTLTILDTILPFMEQQSELYDCYLLQALLKNYLARPDWRESFLQAQVLAPPSLYNKLLDFKKRLDLYSRVMDKTRQ